MSLRKQARQLVVQMLYQIDLNPDITGGDVRRMIDEHGRNNTTRTFAWQLFTGVMEFKPQIDAEIVRVAENWSLKRMAVTDRNIIRLGGYELLHTDTPTAVVIDEAVELAREFGSANSSQFVNGILDKLVPRADNQITPAEAKPALPAVDQLDESAEDLPLEKQSPQEKMHPKPPSTPYRKLNNPWAT
ncbi:MAG: transcription antitermination factor NusB [Planctomycetota bacterium]|jgi:transcription antitermination protein NusB|uniref:transcription antitermination factor NusB n=1 Tax=uncultured Gimesia sp. TaxID=1678688 RepID=UPI0026253B7A|nr:transcription antitermination factor NusB [uncultured Gimesia sp.]